MSATVCVRSFSVVAVRCGMALLRADASVAHGTAQTFIHSTRGVPHIHDARPAHNAAISAAMATSNYANDGNNCKYTHRGARTHDHKVKSLALYRLS